MKEADRRTLLEVYEVRTWWREGWVVSGYEQKSWEVAATNLAPATDPLRALWLSETFSNTVRLPRTD